MAPLILNLFTKWGEGLFSCLGHFIAEERLLGTPALEGFGPKAGLDTWQAPGAR